MRPHRPAAVLLASATVAVTLSAQQEFPLHATDAARMGHGEIIDLFQNDPHDRWYGNISVPTLTVFLPPADKATGTGVIICPGGGFHRELYDREGIDVARWLNSIGVAGFVLKYRLPSESHVPGEEGMPLEDALRAIRLVRSHAGDWKLKDNRIGILGFSAGGQVGANAATLWSRPDPKAADPVDRLNSRPDFAALIYPVISSEVEIAQYGKSRLLGPTPTPEIVARYSAEKHIQPTTPPTFLVYCADDPILVPDHVLRYVETARKTGVPVELHFYETGGHGFGVGQISHPGGGSWPLRFQEWLQARFNG